LTSPRILTVGLSTNRPVSTGGGWFGIAVTAFVTSTKLSYVEPG